MYAVDIDNHYITIISLYIYIYTHIFTRKHTIKKQTGRREKLFCFSWFSFPMERQILQWLRCCTDPVCQSRTFWNFSIFPSTRPDCMAVICTCQCSPTRSLKCLVGGWEMGNYREQSRACKVWPTSHLQQAARGKQVVTLQFTNLQPLTLWQLSGGRKKSGCGSLSLLRPPQPKQIR